LRIGTPAVTTRGFTVTEVTALAGWMCDILDDINNESMIAAVREKVVAVCAEHPVYAS
ncbi:MAG: serine hydroxymethyltransferase, partial [Gammaproteobacteria bacterium]